MVAPVTIVDPFHQEGTLVIGALEVEAKFGQEFKIHEEELLQILASIASALLDIMRQIRNGDKDKKKGIGVLPLQAAMPAATPIKPER